MYMHMHACIDKKKFFDVARADLETLDCMIGLTDPAAERGSVQSTGHSIPMWSCIKIMGPYHVEMEFWPQ